MAKNKRADMFDSMIGSGQNEPKSIKDRLGEETKETGSFIRVNFFIAKSQRDKLKEYTQQIAPAHIKISQSELIRYMIENFDLEKAKENYFK